ncbi:MAG: non-canonical purine NTP pyrophosphatase [Acidobacteria bacterium]|nr:non-canonical purine NTP pyrophosphatase [Acidobacteriota bacterium]
MLKVLLASRNAGKLQEFAELLPGFDLHPWPREAPEIPEEGCFFQDNALQKAGFARAWWRAHGTGPLDAVLADDSGLCVDALWGGPGVLSARFGKGLGQLEKNLRLLDMLPPEASRTARFVCVLALLPLPEGRALITSGQVEGRLAGENRGAGGFGFDPIFIPEGHTQTFGELAPGMKHALSHRGRACERLRAILQVEFDADRRSGRLRDNLP